MSSPVLLVLPTHDAVGDLVHLAADAAGATDGPVRSVRPEGVTPLEQARFVAACAGELGAATVVLESSRRATQVAAYVAHTLDAGVLVDVSRVWREGEAVLLGEKRELGGTWDVTCSVSGPAVVLARPALRDGAAPQVQELTDAEIAAARESAAAAVGSSGAGVGRDVELVASRVRDGDAAALGSAAVVVAGGRGLEGDLGPVRALADAIGGAVGATRDIVEEGWIGPEAMVGQTGTMIAPRLYIGAGLSGAPHHMLGMRAAETIVAINLDPEAPIMEAADLAIVGDAAEVLTQAARIITQ